MLRWFPLLLGALFRARTPETRAAQLLTGELDLALRLPPAQLARAA